MVGAMCRGNNTGNWCGVEMEMARDMGAGGLWEWRDGHGEIIGRWRWNRVDGGGDGNGEEVGK